MIHNMPLWLRILITLIVVGVLVPGVLLLASSLNLGYGLAMKQDREYEFQWRGLNGESHSFSSIEADYVYVFMGFFACSELCPLRLHQLRQFDEQLTQQAYPNSIRFLLISIDPNNDPVTWRKDYIEGISDRFISAELDENALQALQGQLQERVRKQGGTTSHAANLYVFDQHKKLVRVYSQLSQPKGALFNDLMTMQEFR